MKKEIKSTLKKTVKIAGVTCLAAGSIAIVTSSAALKAIGEGSKYLLGTIKNILKEAPAVQEAPEVTGEDFSALQTESTAPEECPAEEEVIGEEPAAAQETI